MFTPADTISIPTSRLKENIPDIAAIYRQHALGLQSSAVQDCFKLCPHSVLLSIRFIIAFLQ